MMSEDNWTTPEALANRAAEELAAALSRHGIDYLGCFSDDDGDVSVSFVTMRDAETALSLGMPADPRPGTTYDRATASCVTLNSWARTDFEPTDADVAMALQAGWQWTIHPHTVGRNVGWHCTVDLPSADANVLTANLNAVPGGEL